MSYHASVYLSLTEIRSYQSEKQDEIRSFLFRYFSHEIVEKHMEFLLSQDNSFPNIVLFLDRSPQTIGISAFMEKK